GWVRWGRGLDWRCSSSPPTGRWQQYVVNWCRRHHNRHHWWFSGTTRVMSFINKQAAQRRRIRELTGVEHAVDLLSEFRFAPTAVGDVQQRHHGFAGTLDRQTLRQRIPGTAERRPRE